MALCSAATVSFADASDISAAVEAAGLRYSFDFNNGGDFIDAGDVSNASTASTSHTYTSAGGQNKAIRKTFAAAASSSGTITIGFTAIKDNAKVSGISIVPSA